MTDAAPEGEVQEGGLGEHPDAEARGLPAETGDRDRHVEGGQEPQEAQEALSPAWAAHCTRCGKTFKRKSRKGKRPSVCYECRADQIKDQINNLREHKEKRPGYELDGTPIPSRHPARLLKDYEQEAEDRRRVAREAAPVPEPSWLDDPAVQSQLARKRQEPPAAPPDAGEAPEEPPRSAAGEGSSGPECEARGCRTPPRHPAETRGFCENHWNRVPYDLRGVLLVSEPTSEVFRVTVNKILKGWRMT